MVQVTFDTNSDSLEELKEALILLQQAVERRGGHVEHKVTAHAKPSKLDIAQPEEEAIETPFFKITVKSEEEKKVPTLNEMIEDESLTEDELTNLFHEQVDREHDAVKAHPPHEVKEKPKEESSESYIEIVEYTDEKQ